MANTNRGRESPTVEPTTGGPARGFRQTRAFLGLTHLAKLDKEVLRRKAVGEDRDHNGNRINVNRSTVIRDLIDAAYPD